MEVLLGMLRWGKLGVRDAEVAWGGGYGGDAEVWWGWGCTNSMEGQDFRWHWNMGFSSSNFTPILRPHAPAVWHYMQKISEWGEGHLNVRKPIASYAGCWPRGSERIFFKFCLLRALRQASGFLGGMVKALPKPTTVQVAKLYGMVAGGQWLKLFILVWFMFEFLQNPKTIEVPGLKRLRKRSTMTGLDFWDCIAQFLHISSSALWSPNIMLLRDQTLKSQLISWRLCEGCHSKFQVGRCLQPTSP